MSEDGRGRPFPELHGERLLAQLLDEIEEEEGLSRQLGVDLTPPAPETEEASRGRPPLERWLERSLEVHRFLMQQRLAERRQGGP